MNATLQNATTDFYTYPPVGDEDWRYTFAAAKVRTLETRLLGRSTFVDMANAPDFASALDLLSSSDYTLGSKEFADVEKMLLQRRSDVRELFKTLIIDKPLLELLREKDDFANLRLALRRKLLDKPIGTDYSNEGSIPAEQLEQIFEEENYAPLPIYMQEAIEEAVLAYYEDKNIRRIDFALDNCQAHHKLDTAREINSIFLESLFRIQIDILNIRTMLRVRFTEAELRDLFVEGGFVEIDRFKQGLDTGDEAIAGLFFATPYYDVINTGVSYLTNNNSFLKLEANCDSYVAGFLAQTRQITAGPQPVIAYLLTKEAEIRTVRLILTGKKNNLDAQLLLDRIGE